MSIIETCLQPRIPSHPTNCSNRKSPKPTQQLIRSVPAKARELLTDARNGLPVWIRSPKGEPEHYTGFSRSKLYELDANRLIRSVSIRQPGQVKGTRLFNLESVLAYIESCERIGMKGPAIEVPSMSEFRTQKGGSHE